MAKIGFSFEALVQRLLGHEEDNSNPHEVDKDQVGLGNVNNWNATSAVNDSSNSKYATAGAVKQAYDKGVQALNTANGKLGKSEKAVDADKLDGVHASQFVRHDQDQTNNVHISGGVYTGRGTTQMDVSPSELPVGFSQGDVDSASTWPIAYGLITTFQVKLNRALQFFNGKANELYFRTGDDKLTDGWSDIQRIYNDSYHPNADKLTTARTISLTGDASGSVSFNGSANVSIPVVVANDSHTHDGRYYTESEVDTKLAGKLGKTEKAADAQLLDGKDSSLFVQGEGAHRTTREDDLDSMFQSGFYNASNPTNGPTSAPSGGWFWYLNSAHTNGHSNSKYGFQIAAENSQTNSRFWMRSRGGGGDGDWTQLYTVRHKPTAADVGALPASGKAVDSDKLDGVHHSGFLRRDINTDSSAKLTLLKSEANSVSDCALRFGGTSGSIVIDTDGDKRLFWNDGAGNFGLRGGHYYNNGEKYVGGNGAAKISLDTDGIDGKITLGTALKGADGGVVAWGPTLVLTSSTIKYGGQTIWHSGNDGAGSELDADKLDGLQASQFLRSDASDTFTGLLTAKNQTDGIYFNHVSASATPAHRTSGCAITGGSDYAGLEKANNITAQTWYGFSVSSTYSAGVVPQGEVAFSVDARTGSAHLFSKMYVDKTQRVFADNYHPNADKWTTARTITLAGDLTGSVSIDGTANKTLTAEVKGNSHNHTSLTGVTSIAFKTDATDNAGLATTVSGTTTYFDSYLKDDSADKWRWRFTPLGSTAYSAMELASVSDGNANLTVSGNVIADAFKGNADTASKWKTARTVTFDGDLQGSVSIDGSANTTLTATVKDDSHNHVISNVDGLQSALDGKLPKSGGTITGSLKTTDPVSLSDFNTPWENCFIQASNPANTPKGLTGWFWGISTGHTSNHADYRYGMQLVTGGDNGLFYRVRGENGSGTWYQVYTENYKPSKADVGLSNVNNWTATSSTSDSSNSKYTTAGAVKQAYDKAVAADNNANTRALSSRTITASNGLTGGGSLAGNRTISGVNASTSAKGVVQLSDSISSTSTTLAATANAVRKTILGFELNQDRDYGWIKFPNALGSFAILWGRTSTSSAERQIHNIEYPFDFYCYAVKAHATVSSTAADLINSTDRQDCQQTVNHSTLDDSTGFTISVKLLNHAGALGRKTNWMAFGRY